VKPLRELFGETFQGHISRIDSGTCLEPPIAIQLEVRCTQFDLLRLRNHGIARTDNGGRRRRLERAQ
jgi:hypothetical protein